jgi:hypothetical protein
MATAAIPVKINCRSCATSTRHEILFAMQHEAAVPFYEERHTWQVVRCLGCETVGFRYRMEDFDNAEEMPDGSMQPKVAVFRYPNAIANHKQLVHLYAVPDLIQKVYKQSVAAYAGDSRIIASMGLRATIEAVCTHLSISGTSLEKRIDSLFKNGHISSSDKKRLHGIRFLGNDAAHDIREPGTNEFRIALEIIEHLISSVFILNQRAQGLLDTTIETFTEFLPVLEGCARGLETDTSVTLAGLLGKHRRRLGIEFPQLETELIAKITSQEVNFLALGAIQEIDNKSVQLYMVVREGFEDDDIPF